MIDDYIYYYKHERKGLSLVDYRFQSLMVD
ncbi:IS3 family transposase [Pectobacterium brasiliense]|nr:IS3 family transposase [Pectobacterium brasiliense]